MVPEKKYMIILSELCIPANLKGYRYLIYALSLCIDDISMIDNINKKLYPQIANKFSTTKSAVERCIRHAIEISLQRTRPKVIESYFGKHSSRVTSAEFIATLAFTMLASEQISVNLNKHEPERKPMYD